MSPSCSSEFLKRLMEVGVHPRLAATPTYSSGRVERWQEATTGDDSWQPWLANHIYGTDFTAVSPTNPGRNMGWTDWTHGADTAAD